MIYVTSASGETEANCTAQSRPAADITWDVGGSNLTLGPSVTSADSQGDGTTIVRSTLLFQSRLLKDVSVKCIIHHHGLKKPLTLSLNTNGEKIANPHVTNSRPLSLFLLFEFVHFCGSGSSYNHPPVSVWRGCGPPSMSLRLFLQVLRLHGW